MDTGTYTVTLSAQERGVVLQALRNAQLIEPSRPVAAILAAHLASMKADHCRDFYSAFFDGTTKFESGTFRPDLGEL